MVLGRSVVGSDRAILNEDAEILGKVWILNDAEALVFVELSGSVEERSIELGGGVILLATTCLFIR